MSSITKNLLTLIFAKVLWIKNFMKTLKTKNCHNKTHLID